MARTPPSADDHLFAALAYVGGMAPDPWPDDEELEPWLVEAIEREERAIVRRHRLALRQALAAVRRDLFTGWDLARRWRVGPGSYLYPGTAYCNLAARL
jgi:hypothetical protein